MSSSQRAENGHAFFKEFVSKGNSLVNFMIQFDKGLVRQHHKELIADHKDIIKKPKIIINHDFLAQMADIYTNEMYYKFECEACDSFNYRFQFVKEIDNQRVYRIQRTKVATSKVREVVYDKDLDFASCCCKLFERTGIPCKHIIAYLMRFDTIHMLPDKYILKRWTKFAKLGTVIDDKSVHIDDDNCYLLMRSQFIQSSLDLVDKSLLCEEIRKMFTNGVRTINEQIDQFINSRIGVMAPTEKSNPIGDGTSAHASCSYLTSLFSHPLILRTHIVST